MTPREMDQPLVPSSYLTLLSRRSLLKRAVVLSAGLPAIAGLLSACADEDEVDEARRHRNRSRALN
jgi:hypothetical protein